MIERKHENPEEGSESCNLDLTKNGKQKSPRNEIKPLTLVLDLDETLVHSSKIRPETDHEALIVNLFFVKQKIPNKIG